MSLAWIKVCAAALVLLVGLAGAMLPWGSPLLRPTDRMLALGDTFAGGVLGGAGLIHLLGGGISAFRAAEPRLAYPAAQVLAGAGFLLVLLIEGVIVADRPVPGHGGHGSAPARHELGSPPRGTSLPYAFILLIVLSVHSVILGVALGAQQSARSLTVVLLAIVAHKGVAGFALGVSYQRSGQPRARALPSIALFAAMTPAGILAGTAVSTLLSTHAGLLFEAVFDSAGAGTFVYIAALDITRTEFDTPEDRWPKWVSATAGFAAMAVLAIWLLSRYPRAGVQTGVMKAVFHWVLAMLRPALAAWPRVVSLLARAQARLQRGLAVADAFQQRHVWLSFPFAVARKVSNDGGGALAGLIAYYGFLAVFPLLLVFAAVLGFVLAGDPALKAHALSAAESSFPALKGYISKTISGNEVALGVGLAGALWAGLGVTRATERAMNAIWDIPRAERPNLWWSRLRGLAMLVVLGGTFLVSTALTSLQSVGGALALPASTLAVGGALLLNAVLYLLAFQVLTNRHLAWRQIFPGALVGAVGWTVLQNLGAFYVRHEIAHASQLYGSLAAVVGLLAWIYLGAQLTLYAAEVNVVLADRLWPRSLRGEVSTDADRRALTRQAREAGQATGQVISVSFGGTAAEAHPAPSALATGQVPPAFAAHAAVTHLAAHLEEFDRCRQQADACDDPAERDGLRRRRQAVADAVAAALSDLARQDADLSAALARHLH